MPRVGLVRIKIDSCAAATKCVRMSCSGTTLKGSACTRLALEGQTKCKQHAGAKAPLEVEDTYTPELLASRWASHKAYVLEGKACIEKTGLPLRLPTMPEDISENLVKFIIHNWVGDKTSKWTKGIKGSGAKISGDLVSAVEKAQESKCFTSDGPPSFGPTEHWDVIYFLDAREWLKDHLVLWRVPLTNSSKEWKGIKINASETFGDHCDAGRRPRITWESLYPQIKDHAVKVFDGSFKDIFRA